MEEGMLFEDMVKEYVDGVVRDFMSKVPLGMGTKIELRSKAFLKYGTGLRIELVIKPQKRKGESHEGESKDPERGISETPPSRRRRA